MANLSAAGGKLLAFWGPIQSAVASRMSTADLWSSVRDAAAAHGYDLSGVSITDMNVMRSLAAGNRNANEVLQRAAPGQALTGLMIGSELSTRSAVEQSMIPLWIVRFEHNVISGGVAGMEWRTSQFQGMLPPTKAELQAQLEADGQAYADDYGTEHVSIGDIAITTI